MSDVPNIKADMGGGVEKVVKANLPSNSHKTRTTDSSVPKDEKPKVKKVISGEAVQRKKGLGRKIAETFTGEDMKSVGYYILFDVVIPAAKSMISDAASQGVERLLFGDVRNRARPGASRTVGGHTAYNRVSKPEPGRSISQRARATHDFDEIVLPTRGEAEEVLDRLTDLIDSYDVATVTDLFDLVGITGSFTDDRWGWFDLRGATVVRVRDGYLLNLPKTTPVDG